MDELTIALWIFPPDDIVAWQALTGFHLNYAEYLSVQRSLQSRAEADGHSVQIVRMAVEEMQRRLLDASLPNTPEHRAQIIAQFDGRST
jgi:hypothetical protein